MLISGSEHLGFAGVRNGHEQRGFRAARPSRSAPMITCSDSRERFLSAAETVLRALLVRALVEIGAEETRSTFVICSSNKKYKERDGIVCGDGSVRYDPPRSIVWWPGCSFAAGPPPRSA